MTRLTPVLALFLAAGASAQCGDPQTMHTDDREADDFLGGAISMSSTASGISLLAGVGADDTGVLFTQDRGSVYQFTRINGVWGQTNRFAASDGMPEDYFGTSVAYADPYALIGAVGVGDTGAVYFFERFGSTWVQRGRAIPAGTLAGDDLGRSTAIWGEMGVVGAPFHDIEQNGSIDLQAGAAYVFRRNGDGTWSQIFKLWENLAANRAPGDLYGQAVAMAGTKVMVGVPGADSFNVIDSGRAEVVRFNEPTGQWFMDGEFWAPDRGEDDRFGNAVDIAGVYAVVGAPRHDSAGHLDNGAVYAWRHDGTQWVYDGKMTPSDPADNAQFGSGVGLTVSLLGPTRVAIAASGAKKAYVFRRVGAGEWVQDARYLDPDGPDSFGTAIAAYNEHVIVGDWGDDPLGATNAGALYAFQTPVSGSDTCAGATSVFAGGAYGGCTETATLDGLSGCLSGFQFAPDVWYKYTATCTGRIAVDTFNSGFDTVLSVHTGCPGNGSNMVACNDDWSIFTNDSSLMFPTVAGETYLIRVSGVNGAKGQYQLHVGDCDDCYADCNIDGVLTVADFGCFQTKFVAGEAYADCNGDGARTVADFGCFQTKFVTGCP